MTLDEVMLETLKNITDTGKKDWTKFHYHENLLIIETWSEQPANW